MASALLALSLIQPPAAPEPPPPKLVVRISVELVQVDAIVTDSKGRHVTDLQASDFEIFEDGRRQELTNFAYELLAPESDAGRGAEATTLRSPGLRPDDVRRTIAIVVNDVDLSFEDTFRVRRAVAKFVDEQLGPRDLAAVLRTSTGGGTLEQFTHEKDRLRAAVEEIQWGRGGWRPDKGSEPRLRTLGSLSTLSLALRALAGLPGRKALVFFSAGFDPVPGDEFEPPGHVREALQPLLDLANRASVVFYTIDPRGLLPGAFDMSSGQAREREQIGLRVMADDSGGLFYGQNAMDEGLARVASDQKGYYLLGYVPQADTFTKPGSADRYHRVTVKVKRSGLKVRSRTGFFGVGDSDFRRAGGGGTLLERALSPFASADFRLHFTSLFLDEPGLGPFLQNLLHVDGHDLAFVDNADGTKSATLEVLTVVFDSRGTVLAQSTRRLPLRPTREEHALLERLGYTYATRLPLPRPGAYQVRTAVRDAATDRFGTASQLVEAPDLKRGVALTSLVVSAPGGGPSPSADGDVGISEASATPALRVFRQGGALEYAVNIHNPTAAKGGLSGRVFLLREGREIYASQPAAPTPPSAAGSPAVFAGQLKLGAPLAAGDYVLRVEIKDLQPRAPRSWSRSTDFELR